jgi:hypothetical protein
MLLEHTAAWLVSAVERRTGAQEARAGPGAYGMMWEKGGVWGLDVI